MRSWTLVPPLVNSIATQTRLWACASGATHPKKRSSSMTSVTGSPTGKEAPDTGQDSWTATIALLSIVALRGLGVCAAPAGEGPLALERGKEEHEEGGERAQGGQPTQAVPPSAVRGGETGGDGLQPHGLFPVGAHLVSESRGALSDAGFAALDQQEVRNARLRVDRQGQELVVEKARVQLDRDSPPPAHEILDTGLLSATVHQALTLAKRRYGVVDILS